MKTLSRFQKTTLIMFSAGVLITPALAHAQSGDTNNRLQRLENEIETLSRAIYRGEAPPVSGGAISGSAATSAQTEVRLQQMETDIRDLRGRVEEQDFQVRELKKQLEMMSSDIDLRLKDLEGGRSGASSGFDNGAVSSSGSAFSMPDSQSTPSYSDSGNSLGTISSNASDSGFSGSVSVGKNPSSQYEHAFSMLKSSNYDAAEQEFSQFLASNPDHALAGNAKYWLGETYYVRGNYEQAARVFAEGYQQYPDSPKAPDNLLKLGMALASSGNKGDACIALRQLKKQYSSGSEPVLRRADQEISKLGC